MFPPDAPSDASTAVPHDARDSPEPAPPGNFAEHPFSSLPPSDYTSRDAPPAEQRAERALPWPSLFRPPCRDASAAPCAPETPHTPPAPPDGSFLMKLGTLVVIGAMAANVFGFRHSRWAVGKDIHRAWQRRQQQSTSHRSYAQSRAEEELRRMRDAFARAEREEAQARVSEQQARAQRQQERANDNDRERRQNVRAQYAQWERRFEQDGNGAYREQFRMQFDAKMIEDILKQFGQAGRMGFGVNRSSFPFDDRIIEELLKAARHAQQQQRQQRGNARFEQDFDAFRFWEAMNGAQWRDYARGGANTGGVHQRVGVARHYQALGLQQGASEDDVKKAYRREVMKWHPDRYRGEDKTKAARRFREVTDAYAALTKK